MARFCTQCGNELASGSRFCGNCGAALADELAASAESLGSVATAVPSVPAPMQDEPEASPYLPVEAEVEMEESWQERLKIVPLGYVLGALAIAAGGWWFYNAGNSGPTLPENATSVGNAVESVAVPTLSGSIFYSVAAANVRDKPTTNGSQVVGKLARAARLEGTMEQGADGTSQWLKLADGKGYVSAVNLSETEPPKLARLVGKTQSLGGEAKILAAADENGMVLQTVPEGTPVQIVGLTESGFAEITLKRGGVGYLAPSAVAALSDQAQGSTTLVKLNVGTCDFGPELEPWFKRGVAASERRYAETNAKEYGSEEEKEAALEALQGKSTYVSVNKLFRGVRLTAVGLHFESRSIHFAEEPAKVTAAFKAAGYTISADGQFAGDGPGASATLYAAGRDEIAQGKTVVSCGS